MVFDDSWFPQGAWGIAGHVVCVNIRRVDMARFVSEAFAFSFDPRKRATMSLCTDISEHPLYSDLFPSKHRAGNALHENLIKEVTILHLRIIIPKLIKALLEEGRLVYIFYDVVTGEETDKERAGAEFERSLKELVENIRIELGDFLKMSPVMKQQMIPATFCNGHQKHRPIEWTPELIEKIIRERHMRNAEKALLPVPQGQQAFNFDAPSEEHNYDLKGFNLLYGPSRILGDQSPTD